MADLKPCEPSFLESLTGRQTRFAQPRAYQPRDFLYGHIGPAPQVSRDHPFGQAPVVLNIPAEEMRDWEKSVGARYRKRALSYGRRAMKFAAKRWIGTGGAGYAPVSNDDFQRLISEGLYSKFLCKLDPVDLERFGDLAADPSYEYWKSDYSCMSVVKRTLPGTYVAPTVVLLRAPLAVRSEEGLPVYEVVAIALAWLDKSRRESDRYGEYVWLDAPLREGHGEAWELAKYFALQGAIHRINLMDHTRVHFPSDAMNAITKTVLPKNHLVFQLLEPHFRLTLGVNHAVIEGRDSLINRNENKVYTPFVANGREIRKLFPFAWYGSTYYGGEENSAYPPFKFDRLPPDHPSEYGKYMEAYFQPIEKFVRAVLEYLPSVADKDKETDWLEIQRWADHISTWIPGFPCWKAFVFEDEDGRARALDLLAATVADIIHNASVVHSADHASLHHMIENDPVPFILRVKPPRSAAHRIEPKSKAVARSESARSGIRGVLEAFGVDDEVDAALNAASNVVETVLGLTKVRLCSKTDLFAARFADLLFYLPHNTTLLIDCLYRFESRKHRLYRQLHPLVERFKADLHEAERAVQHLADKHHLPLLEPHDVDDAEEREVARQTICIGAGIQY